MTDTGLTVHDYEFLKGNKEFWPCWGAAMSVTYTYCKGNGYGEWGNPTDKGKKAMEFYERENQP